MLKKPMKSRFLGSLRSKQTGVKIVSIALFVFVIAFVFYQGTKTTVALTVNGETTEVSTHAHTVAALLEAKDIDVSKHDTITPSLSTKIDNGMSIKWEQAKEIIISVDGNQSNVWTAEKVVKNILEEANIEVKGQDFISRSLDTEIGAENKIEIQKAFQLKLVDGLKERQVWSTSTTVANFLKQQGIQLNEFDRVDKGLENVIIPNGKIAVVRVEKVTDVVEESKDFAVEKKNDSTLLKGKEKVVTQGQNGKIERSYAIVKENGKTVSKQLMSEKVLEHSKTKIVAVGTKVVTASVSRSTSEPKKSKEFYVEATAYTPYCAGCSGISAAGINLRDNPNLKIVAVDPNIIPLGTKVWVEDYGYAVAGDTGGAIKGNKIDILVQSKAQANSWGRKKVRIKVLN